MQFFFYQHCTWITHGCYGLFWLPATNGPVYSAGALSSLWQPMVVLIKKHRLPVACRMPSRIAVGKNDFKVDNEIIVGLFEHE